MFFKRNRPNSFHIISTLEDINNDFEHHANNNSWNMGAGPMASSSSISIDFHQKYWWPIKLSNQTSKSARILPARITQPSTSSTPSDSTRTYFNDFANFT